MFPKAHASDSSFEPLPNPDNEAGQHYEFPRAPRNSSYTRLTGAPCALLLGVLALHLDDQPLSTYGERVVQGTRLGPTIYPIVFAAIVSRFFRNLARWSAERPRGVTLGALEQIHGSQSFAGTLERALSLRTHVAIALASVAVWAMSPLGGQSSSRLLYIGPHIDHSDAAVYFAHPSYGKSQAVGPSGLSAYRPLIYGLYSASLMTRTEMQRAPTDLWRRPKIPMWAGDGSLATDEAGWQVIDHDALLEGRHGYSSMLGIGIEGLEANNSISVYDFPIETSYIDMDCKAVTLSVAHDDTGKYTLPIELNLTQLVSSSFRSSFKAVVDLPRAASSPLGFDDPPAIFYASRQYNDNTDESGIAIFNCTTRPVVMETSIRCGPLPATDCIAVRQRLVRPDDSPRDLWPPNLDDFYLRILLAEWPLAAGDVDYLEDASPTDNYLAGDDNIFQLQTIRSWEDVDMGVFSRRFTTVFNTLWQATLDPLSATMTTYTSTPGGGEAPDSPMSRPVRNETQAVVSTTYDVYRADRTWIAILLLTTLILQVIALASLALDVCIRGPDLIGYASSLTRDNPYVPLHDTGSTLDGPMRSRLLRGMRVQVADVQPDEDIGHIAFKEVYSGARWVPLDRDRVYR
ncbi:uncharacterized protein DNG_09658 [Cephalotrichum gorgonifer]|uniref:Uncharacterized protein n=1 Tax=Cephalotrichum gorgonifer TaxID=2041049 RepID=A0AAE8N7N1_9PEZI|nr:uncharacterized protein DNG_09658 [Cephalotrichum gorgonifer]